MAITITIDKNDLPRIAANLEPRVSQVVRKAAFDIEGKAKAAAPVDEGHLKNSIQASVDGLSAEVTANADYAAYVEYGTAPHVIRPRNAKVLAFQAGGKTVFAAEVNHPGTPAQPFMTPAAEAVRPAFIAAMTQAIRGA